jgi:hypothetical protein
MTATLLAPPPPVALAPPPPQTFDDLGVAVDLVEQLLIKTLYTGETTGHDLADRLRVPYSLIEPLVERARAERLVEVKGAHGSGTAAYRYALTDLGRDRGRMYLDANGYIGAVPVPLSVYVRVMKTAADARPYIGRDRLQQAFTGMVVADALLEQVGPAVNGAKALFLYGPPGNGKTIIAQGIGQAIGDELYVPYAISIDGAIITLYDPITHHAIPTEEDLGSVVATASHDRRWIRIRRPVVVVGGELTLDQLDLTFNPIAKFYDAPIQLKANGGVFLVDDFGRQRMRPEDLLNRWIVPLESRVDYLTLHTGKKFQVPFDVLLIFATNLNPTSLADEAFLRRIPYKVPVGDPTLPQFTSIFEMNCQRRNLPFSEAMVAYLYREHYAPFARPLRSCQPRDLLDQVVAQCRYRGITPAITRETLDAACAAYFVDNAMDSGRPQ